MRLVASVVVVALGVSVAAAQPALSPPGETPPTTVADSPTRPGPELESSTVTGQILLGGVLGLGGLIAGGYLMFGLCGTNGCSNDDGVVVALVLGAYAGGSLGIAGGTYLVGNNDKAEGSFGAAFGGALVGGVAGIAAAAAVDKTLGYGHDDAKGLLETGAVVGGWIGGSLVGYYLTRHWKTPALDRVRPMVTANARGMAFGVGTSF